jgi:UDP-glucuronate 4-epimerase
MKVLVTGAAGFIGSHLCRRLLKEGHVVVGLDSFDPYYEPEQKRRNLSDLMDRRSFSLREGELQSLDLDSMLSDVGVVFHLAGQPGVRGSWRDGFVNYISANVLATQELLEAVGRRGSIRVVYASSSSIYGDAPIYPTAEDVPPQPQSPYGVTKLAGEHLCLLYGRSYGFPVTCLRYFTVYGPAQRPDMAIGRLLRSCLGGTPFRMFGDGTQVRDFTYVDDVVDANLRAAARVDEEPAVVNIAGGSSVSMREMLELAEEVTGSRPTVEWCSAQEGDVSRTGASIQLARQLLGWQPATELSEGLRRQARWESE